jgi:hypothetical protein
MIILSVGMPRAGSGWYYNLTNDLMLAHGAQDARQIRQRYRLQNILTEVNCNIGALTPRRLLAVMLPSLLGNTFVIKAHAGPTPLAQSLIRGGMIRPTYIYRDPRDALLSAMENGRRAHERGQPNAFSHLLDFDTALDFMLTYVQISQAWMECHQMLHTCFETFLTDYRVEADRLINFLPLELGNPKLEDVVTQYQPEKGMPNQKGTHFSQGKIGRFRSKMTEAQQEKMAQVFGSYLESMGYAI